MVIFGLKNHAPDDFKEVTRQEHTSKDGGPIETQSLTPTQRAEQAVRLVDGAVVLTANGLCAILVSALQWPEADVGGYLDALRGRGLLQSGDAPIRTENAALVLLTLVSGFPPTQAVYAALIPLVRPPSGAPCKRCLMLAGSPVTILGVVARLTEI